MPNPNKYLGILILLLAISGSSFSQGYQIDVKIEGMKDAELYLGYYMYGSTYVKDTATYSGSFTYTFQGDESLDRGMYFIAKSTTLLFDIVLGEDQYFEVRTKEGAYADYLEVEGDPDNQLFFENMKFNIERTKEATPFLEMLQDDSKADFEKERAQKEMEIINSKVLTYQNEVIDLYPNSILAVLFKSGRPIIVPSELKSEKSAMKFYREHYWDSFDLGDPLLLKMPKSQYKDKVDEYLDKVIVPNPDSVIEASDKLIAKAKATEVTYQNLVWHLITKYQSSKIMGLDEVYVHLVDTYFLTGKMDFWANDQLKKNLKEKADQYRSSLIGMIAPNLVLQDVNQQPKALHDMPNKFSVIYFYDPDCGHCKKETPMLKAFQDETDYDVGVFSVSADTSMQKMSNYIEEMGLQNWTNTNGTRTYGLSYQEVYDAYTTPTIYILNEDKEIIAKKVAADQLEEVLSKYMESKSKSN